MSGKYGKKAICTRTPLPVTALIRFLLNEWIPSVTSTTMPLRISAKNLGHLALPDACPRCFWIQTRQKVPFQIFPGIFSTLDGYQKKVTTAHFAVHGKAPPWLSSFGDLQPIPVPHHSKFQWFYPSTNVLLTGVPDEMFRRPDGSILIVDDKTAKFTQGQDGLLPIYKVQANGYAVLAEKVGLGKASALALVYHEPVTDLSHGAVNEMTSADGFLMRFRSRVLPLDLDLSMIPPLLRQAKAIYDLPAPPEGREGCKDCQLVDGMLALLKKGESATADVREP